MQGLSIMPHPYAQCAASASYHQIIRTFENGGVLLGFCRPGKARTFYTTNTISTTTTITTTTTTTSTTNTI